MSVFLTVHSTSVACWKTGSKCCSLTRIWNRFIYFPLLLQLSCSNYAAFSCIFTAGVFDNHTSL